jgi:methylthioribose-1-phosphate isomerase
MTGVAPGRDATPGTPDRPAPTAAPRPSVAWTGDAIEIIDQTRLPAELVLIRLATTAAAIDAIGRLAVRGAPAIGGCGALAMVVGIDEAAAAGVEPDRGVVDALAARIEAARPTAVNLSWAVRRVRDAAVGGSRAAAVRERALAEALAIIDEDRAACTAIGEYGRAALQGRDTILTHCNTGRLATLGWGTALGVVYAKAAAGERVRVYACEARPLLQGARLTAWELLDAGIDVTLIPDHAAASLLHTGRVEAVIVGADRIAANGDTANKIGTFSLAIAARHAGVPFYVAAPTSSFDPRTPTGDAIVIEERDADEVRGFAGHLAAPPDVPVWNPCFDVTPHDLVTAWITELGVLQPPFDALPGPGRAAAGDPKPAGGAA